MHTPRSPPGSSSRHLDLPTLPQSVQSPSPVAAQPPSLPLLVPIGYPSLCVELAWVWHLRTTQKESIEVARRKIARMNTMIDQLMRNLASQQ
ncbi:unnamed protein product [Linum trigynum]|uniref:Uncharacterized protein n=1 Tax=Linum trigynum TaxID=586398 RepID=A0AAV2ENY5_9ROSI